MPGGTSSAVPYAAYCRLPTSRTVSIVRLAREYIAAAITQQR
jgi:hypothetical protein